MRCSVALILGSSVIATSPSGALDAADVAFDNLGTHITEDDLQSVIESLDERLLGRVAIFESIELRTPDVDSGWSVLEWPVSDDVDATFQRALTANDANGAWTIVDNILCTSFNQLGRCTGGKRDPDQHSFNFNLELSYQPTTPASELIEQNLNLFPAVGVGWWRPWAFHVSQLAHTSSWNVERGPLGQAFELNKNGNVQIGFSSGAPSRRLHVVGSARIGDSLEVVGTVALNGRLIRAISDRSSGVVFWGTDADTPAEVCVAAGYDCVGAFEMGGTDLSCSDRPATSAFHALCGCSADSDRDGLNSCIDLCPYVADDTNVDLDGDGLGDVCDPEPDDICNHVGALEQSTEALAAYQDNSCESWVDLVQTNWNLQEAVLERADLSRAVLDGSNFAAARMNGARMTHASLAGCIFDGAELEGADLSAASLDHASFVDANLAGADLSDAALAASDLSESRYDESTLFPSGFDYATIPWGLHEEAAPWNLGMIPVPEPRMELAISISFLALSLLARRP